MAAADSPHNGQRSTPEDPRFAVVNQLMAGYIAALGIAQEMEEMALVDPLTGLYNSYKLEEDFEGLRYSHSRPADEQERATDAVPESSAHEHSLLVLDLDHFKRINDGDGGHAEGNRVLRRVGATLKDTLRGNDLPVRLHGERGDEFAVLLPRTTSQQAAKVAENIRQEVERHGDLTVSVGVAGADLNRPLEDNLATVDKALYAAKDAGRNRVVRYEDLSAEPVAPAPES